MVALTNNEDTITDNCVAIESPSITLTDEAALDEIVNHLKKVSDDLGKVVDVVAKIKEQQDELDRLLGVLKTECESRRKSELSLTEEARQISTEPPKD